MEKRSKGAKEKGVGREREGKGKFKSRRKGVKK